MRPGRIRPGNGASGAAGGTRGSRFNEARADSPGKYGSYRELGRARTALQ